MPASGSQLFLALLQTASSKLCTEIFKTFGTKTNTTTTKPFVPGIWGRLHEPKENYAGSGT